MLEPSASPADGGEERVSSIPVVTIHDEEEPDDGGAHSRATTQSEVINVDQLESDPAVAADGSAA
eukprot:6068918-Alexandrium_andersonii.AAC.1